MASGLIDKGRTISQAAKAAGAQKFEAFLAGGPKAANNIENGTHKTSNGHLDEQKGATAGSGEAA